jgi:hypothetical protein
MKATGTYEQVKDVDPLVALTAHTREHIDHWVAKFPPDRKRSALIQGLWAAQEQNGGHLTDELITAVTRYLGLPQVWGYEVASVLFDVRDHAGRRATTSRSARTSPAGSTAPRTSCAHCEQKLRHQARAEHARTAASTSRRKRSAWPRAAARR